MIDFTKQAKSKVNIGKDTKVTVFLKNDLESAKKSIQQFEKQIDNVELSVTQFEIKNEDDAAVLTKTLAIAKFLYVAIENERKLIIKDADKFVRGINAYCLPFKKKLESIGKIGRKQIGDFNLSQEIKRREDEKKMQEEAAKKQADIDAAARKAGVESVVLPPVVTPKKIQPIRTGAGSSSTRYEDTPVVIDFKQLPDDYKMIDEKKLKAAVKAGIRDIPGVRIEKKPITSIRSV